MNKDVMSRVMEWETKLKIKKLTLEELETWASVKVGEVERSYIILFSITLFYGIVFSCLTILKYYAFKTKAWDLGIFTQSLWTTLYANRFLYYTCELFVNPSGSFFAVHFSPILFLVLPFYWLHSTPETLLVLQSFVVALAAFPIYKLAREYAGGRIVGLTFAVAYLMYPGVQWVNWYDFHVQAFLPFLFSYAIYYVVKENWSRYFLFLTLSLMCEEHVAFISLFIGLYIAWKYREGIILVFKKKKPFTKELMISPLTIAMSIIWYWFTLWQRETFFPINPLAINEFLGSGNFSILGAKDPLEIPLLVILRPLNAVQALIYDGHIKLFYIFLLFGPLAFFSFKAPSALIPALPWFTFSLLSQTLVHHTLSHQYEAYVVAFIFIAAIFGLRKNFLKKSELRGVNRSLKKIIACSLIFFVAASPLSPLVLYFFPDQTIVYVGEHEKLLNEVIAKIPPNATVLTQDNIFPQVSNRLEAYVVPNRFLDTGIRELAVNFVNQTIDKVEYILLDGKTDNIATSLVLLLLETKPEFKLIISKDDNTILLYQRKP
jgi:uncharacterized membrane protein